MKLLDLVREHLSEWPDDECVAITQDSTDENGVYYWHTTPTFDVMRCEWRGKGNNIDGLLSSLRFFMLPKDDPDAPFVLCDDYDTAIITREQFEAYNMKDDTPTITATGSLIEWRDRIIEIENLQTKLQNEKRDLYSKISETGFKLDLTGMKK